MNDADDDAPGVELTDEERQALRSLPREMIPPAGLEDRVVGALSAQGLIRAPGAAGGRRPRRTPWLGWAAAAAGLALFASGVVVGQRSAARGFADALARSHTDDPAAQAARVQEAGSDYVRAVAQLADLAAEGDRKAVESGREAATVALHAAALELARLSPGDTTLRLVLTVLEDRLHAAGGRPSGGTAQSTIWF